MERWPLGPLSDAGLSCPTNWGWSGSGPQPASPPWCTALYLLYESHLGWDWVRPTESNRALPPLSISASIIILKVSTRGPMDLPVDTQLKGVSLIVMGYTRLIKKFFSMCLYKLVLSSLRLHTHYHLQTCCFSLLLPGLTGVARAGSVLSNFCLSTESHPLLLEQYMSTSKA